MTIRCTAAPRPPRASGAVLAVVAVLVIVGLALLFASQEGYNPAAAAVVGQRADPPSRSAVDEARDALVGWLARWPGRVPPGAALDPSAEIERRLSGGAPAGGMLRGEVWEERLATFGGMNLIAQSAAAIAREGFAVEEARVRFHRFHRVRTTPAGVTEPVLFYGLPGDEGQPVNEFRGFATSAWGCARSAAARPSAARSTRATTSRWRT